MKPPLVNPLEVFSCAEIQIEKKQELAFTVGSMMLNLPRHELVAGARSGRVKKRRSNKAKIDGINVVLDSNYNTLQAADLLNVHESTLRKWRASDRGPQYKQYGKGGTVVYKGQWLVDYHQASVKRID